MRPAAEKLHRRSIRLKAYDYAQPGAYFVTMVSHAREPIFGQIADCEMHLNAFGRIAAQQWLQLPARFACLQLGAFVIMPNHVHGILVLQDGRGTATNHNDLDEGSSRRAPTEEFGKPLPHSIPTIVRSYKSAVAYRIHLVRGAAKTVVWQRNYYEHIIRDEKDWDRIHTYIESNPFTWAEDEENPDICP